MARTDVTAFDLTSNAQTGTDFENNSTVGIADGHQVLNDGDVFLLVTKSTTSGEITIPAQKTVTNGKDVVNDRVYTIETTNAPKIVGPFPPSIFNDASGKFWINYTASEEAEFSIYPIKMSRAR